MRRSEATKLLTMLAAAYRDAALSDATTEVYETMLLDLDFEVCKLAVGRLICTSKWLPTVAEIRAAAADVKAGPTRTGEEAWGDVLEAIRRFGMYRPPRFRDPLVARCVRSMTWRGLCLGDSEAADRARFIELYNALAARSRADLVAGLELPVAPRRELETSGGLALPAPEPAMKLTREALDAPLAERSSDDVRAR